jgi:LPXTG-motif cell wall-anchored protein
MSIVNRRNAMIGWATWTVGKRVVRRKAKSAVPAVEGGRPNKPAVGLLAGAAAVGGAVLFWRRRRRSDGADETE